MDELQSAKDELTKLYSATLQEDISLLEYLRRVVAYAAFLKTSSVLTLLIASVRERQQAESILETQKANADPVYRKLIEMREQAPFDDDVPDPVPVFSFLSGLEEIHEDFMLLGDSKTEEEFKEKKILQRLHTKDGSGWVQETVAGNTLLVYAEYDYPKKLMIFHKQIIKEIDTVLANGNFPTYLGYVPSTGVLYVQGKPVQINNRKVPTNAHCLLKYLFSHDPFIEHCYDDMVAQNALFEEKTWTVYYHTCKDIQKKVKDATGIDDFLDFSTGTSLYVRINPKYSLNSRN